MKSNSPHQDQQSYQYSDLKEILNPEEPLYLLSEKIPWIELEKGFTKYYVEFGRPAKPLRLMVSLLLLKKMYNFLFVEFKNVGFCKLSMLPAFTFIETFR